LFKLVSVKLSVIGNVKVPPAATDAGNAADPTWKSVEEMLGLGFEIATLAVQVNR
jgi:hypothetical protein